MQYIQFFHQKIFNNIADYTSEKLECSWHKNIKRLFIEECKTRRDECTFKTKSWLLVSLISNKKTYFTEWEMIKLVFSLVHQNNLWFHTFSRNQRWSDMSLSSISSRPKSHHYSNSTLLPSALCIAFTLLPCWFLWRSSFLNPSSHDFFA